MAATSRLDAGLLIGRKNKFVVFEGATVPYSFIEVKNSPALLANCGSRGKIHERYRHGRMAS
jgi:hypothetical protein